MEFKLVCFVILTIQQRYIYFFNTILLALTINLRNSILIWRKYRINYQSESRFRSKTTSKINQELTPMILNIIGNQVTWLVVLEGIWLVVVVPWWSQHTRNCIKSKTKLYSVTQNKLFEIPFIKYIGNIIPVRKCRTSHTKSCKLLLIKQLKKSSLYDRPNVASSG